MIRQNSQKLDVIGRVSSYISKSQDISLPDNVMLKTKHHILDSVAAMVSGSILKPGYLAQQYVKEQGGTREASVTGSTTKTSAINAAFANGIMAHADETDDSNPTSFTHPGCSIIPAALAMAEKEKSDGLSFLKGVVAGYDIGCRITKALGITHRENAHSSHSIGNNFGAAAAAASIGHLKIEQIKYALSYTAEQASGVYYVHRDKEHSEKAFVFAGMPARNGLTAVVLVQSGFTGVLDPFSGPDNFFEAFSANAKPELFAEELGSRYEIMLTNIKKFSVGSPIQAPLEALLTIMEKYSLTVNDVLKITAYLPDPEVVNNAPMPDINLQYILAVTLLDGGLTFEQSHSYKRMNDPVVQEIEKLITLVKDQKLVASKIPRQGIVEVVTKRGKLYKEHIVNVKGTAKNPMTSEEIQKKCSDLMAPVIGAQRSQQIIDIIFNLESIRSVNIIGSLLAGV